MNWSSLTGSSGIRVATLVVGLATAALAIAAQQRVAGTSNRGLVWLAVVFGLLTFVGFVHSTKLIFSRWMKIAGALHAVVVTLVFGACYLVVVPLFIPFVWRRDPLGLRSGREPATFWVDKRRNADDVDSLGRMG